MFSFHKPKIYRSLQGCCICRAKSSSSRFTDSKKYEIDFEHCFQIAERRAGEICNACVLLVKRWKKLPSGSGRNWHHVVDARAGPGTKSISKMKSKKTDENSPRSILKKKHKHRKPSFFTKPVPDDCHSDGASSHSACSSPAGSDLSDDDDDGHKTATTGGKRSKKIPPTRISSFLDLTYWKKSEICCGIIFRGVNGECLVDTSLLRPCRTCKPRRTDAVAAPVSSSDAAAADASSQDSIMSDAASLTASPLPPASFSAAFGDTREAFGDSREAFGDSREAPFGSSRDCLVAAEAVLDLSLPKQDLPRPPCISMEA